MNKSFRVTARVFLVCAALTVLLPNVGQASSACLSTVIYNCTTINDQVDNNPPNTATAETFTQLLGINDAGMVAGYYGSGMDANHPNKGFTVPNIFAATPTFTPENPAGATQTQVFGVTSAGTTTVGFFQDAAGVQHGFVDVGGTFTTLDDSPGGVAQPVNQLLGVNDHNMAAGFYQDATGAFHAYTVSNLTGTPIFNPIGPSNSMATDINNSGEITGFSFTNAGDTTADGFLINGSTTTTIMYPGSTFTQAFGLNNDGEVVGDYMDAMGVLHGFIYFVNTGQYVSIDPSGSTATTLNGINDQGDIVGFFMDGGIGGDGIPNTDGLLITTPEPATVALMVLASGMLAILYLSRRRRFQ